MKNKWPEMRIMITMNFTHLDQDIPDIYLCSMCYYNDSTAIRCRKNMQNIIYRSSGECSENHKYHGKSELDILPWLNLFHKLSSIYTLISMTQAFSEVGHGLTTRDRGQTILGVATNLLVMR